MTDTGRIERVLEVEAFIASCRAETDAGIAWTRIARPGRSLPRTLYHGSAGVALFYAELYDATNDDRFLAEATGAADDLLSFLNAQESVTIGLYSGWPGYAFVLNEIAKASGDQRFRYGARRCIQRMGEQSQPLGAGIGWVEPMPFSDITGMTGDRELLDLSIGAAGAGLGFLYGFRQDLEERSLEWAVQTAERLIETAVRTDDGLNWPMMDDMPFAFTAPNFAHGAAGVGYFMADLHRATDNPRYLDIATEAARYVEAHTSRSGDGVLVCHTDENPGLNYLGVCHGPPGTGRLMLLLDQITGDDRWLDFVHSNMAGLLATGAPEVRSDGLWANHSQCCGDAGIGDYAISLHRATGRPEYLDLAQRVEAVLIADSTLESGMRSWSQAEHRSRPDFVESQTGYMQGAAGIGSFLLHLATIDEITPSKIALLDSPF